MTIRVPSATDLVTHNPAIGALGPPSQFIISHIPSPFIFLLLSFLTVQPSALSPPSPSPTLQHPNSLLDRSIITGFSASFRSLSLASAGLLNDRSTVTRRRDLPCTFDPYPLLPLLALRSLSASTIAVFPLFLNTLTHLDSNTTNLHRHRLLRSVGVSPSSPPSPSRHLCSPSSSPPQH